MSNVVADNYGEQWGEIFKQMNSKADSQKYRYFNIKSVDYNKAYPELRGAVKNEYSHAVAQLRRSSRITSISEMGNYLNEKIEQEIALERSYYNELAKRVNAVKGKSETKTEILSNLSSLQSVKAEDYKTTIITLRRVLQQMYALTNQNASEDEGGVDGAYNFSRQITSRAVYDKLTPEVKTFFSRNALLGSIGKKSEYKKSINKIEKNLGNQLIDDMFFKGKRIIKIEEETYDALQINVGSGLGKVLMESLGGKDVFVTKTKGKGRTVDSFKAAFKAIVRENAQRALKDGGFKDKKVQTKVNGKVVNYLVSLDENSLKITDENNIIITQVGMESKTAFSEINTLSGAALIKGFYQIILNVLNAVSKAAGESSQENSLVNGTSGKSEDAISKLSAAKWFEKNGEKFLLETLGFDKIKEGQPIDEETTKRVNGLRIFSSSGVSGILGELSAASLKYAGFGATTLTGNTQVEGSQAYYDVSIESSIDAARKIGIQVKNKVTSDSLINLYGEKTNLTMRSTVGLKKYIGEDNVKMFQYFLGNQRAVEGFNYNNLNPISESEIKTTLEQSLPAYITQFMRYEGLKKNSVKNLFYLLKGDLVPSSIILYLLKQEYVGKNKMPISISVVGDMFTPAQKSPEAKVLLPGEVKNLVNNNYLAKTIIQFKGLDVDVNKLIS